MTRGAGTVAGWLAGATLVALLLAGCAAPSSAPPAQAPRAPAPAPTAAAAAAAPAIQATPAPPAVTATPAATVAAKPAAPAPAAAAPASVPATQAPSAAGALKAADTAIPQAGREAPPSAPQPTTVAATATPAAAADAPKAEGGPVEAVPPTAGVPTPSIVIDRRTVELEWASQMRLGNSELVRLTLQPAAEGFIAQAELSDGTLVTRAINIPRPPDYDLRAAARLEGVNYDIAPEAEQVRDLMLGEPMTWRWTVSPRSLGRHPLSLNVFVRQVPRGGGATREYLIFSHGLDIDVVALLGLSAAQASVLGAAGALLGGGISAAALWLRRTRRAPQPHAARVEPNLALRIEARAGVDTRPSDEALLRAVFRRYARVVLETEFRSGYSGARTFLARPIRPDGRSDAFTIAKLGPAADIVREYENFERHVKDTLPPMTARIQEPPVQIPGPRDAHSLAALRYTFIGEPGQAPLSLRQALEAQPDPALLQQLFDTFGPNWWLQRRPYTFRAAVEYDRLLPPHLVIEPDAHAPGSAALADARSGDRVALPAFPHVEPRRSGEGWSLAASSAPGGAPLRVRWLGGPFKPGMTGRVVATREDLLRLAVNGADLFGLPDPIVRAPAWLDETITGTQSTIHGDLNLQNVLVGPGGLLWLIDFAVTRDGHTLFDFAHLAADLVAHVVAPAMDAAAFARHVRGDALDHGPAALALLAKVDALAARCLFNPAQPREYRIAYGLACLGALKFTNLNPHQKHVLLLAAAGAASSMAQRAM